MPSGMKPPVHHRSGVERRTHGHVSNSGVPVPGRLAVSTIRPDSFGTSQGRRTPPSCSATASPACKSVLMKAGAEIGAAEPGVALALQQPQLALRCQGLGIECGVFIDLAVQQRACPRRMRRIERHEQRPVTFDVLQHIHPIRHAHLVARRVAAAEIIPARPDGAPLRHEAFVGVKNGEIAGIAKCAKQVALRIARIGKGGERLVGMAKPSPRDRSAPSGRSCR